MKLKSGWYIGRSELGEYELFQVNRGAVFYGDSGVEGMDHYESLTCLAGRSFRRALGIKLKVGEVVRIVGLRVKFMGVAE